MFICHQSQFICHQSQFLIHICSIYTVLQMIIIALILSLLPLSSSMFCWSRCSTPINASCGSTPYQCTTCPATIYSSCFTPISGISLIQQISANTMSTSEYVMSRPSAPITCTTNYNMSGTITDVDYIFAGTFIGNDYIYKNFSISQDHYGMIIRISIAYVGAWSQYDRLQLTLYDGLQTHRNQLQYTCTLAATGYTQMLCNTTRAGNRVDCLLHYQYTIPHNTSFLLFNLSSLTNQNDPTLHFWSPFDINIYTVDCASACKICFGALTTQCTVCNPGFFLSGTSCLGACVAPNAYHMASTSALTGGSCVDSCPRGYYASGFNCVACASGCLICTASGCTLRLEDTVINKSLWQDKLVVWVLLIIVAALLMVAVIWRIVWRKSAITPTIEQRSMVNDVRNQGMQKASVVQDRNTNANWHIMQIQWNDDIKIDQRPRDRKRHARDVSMEILGIN